MWLFVVVLITGSVAGEQGKGRDGDGDAEGLHQGASEWPSSGQSAGECDLISEFDIGTYRYSQRNSRDDDSKGCDDTLNIAGGGFTVDAWIGGNDDLGDRTIAQSSDELGQFEVIGTDPGEWVNDAMEDMIAAAEFTGSFDGGDVCGPFDDTDGIGFSSGGLTEFAWVGLGEITALATELYFLSNRDNCFGEFAGVGGFCVENEEGKPSSGFFPNAG